MFTLVWTAHFTRSARKFTKRHPELKKKVAGILRDLERDPFQPHLDYHPLGDRQTGIQAVSITDSNRITMTVMIMKKEVILLDIGSHDEVYK